jgi:drug/metabolite transporter (DMT)-like permease
VSSREFLGLVLLGALWGGSYPLMRVAVPEFGPVALAALRVFIAALLLLPIVAARRRLSGLKTHAGPLLVNGIMNSAAPFLLLAYAMLSLTAGFAAIVNATAPFFAALVSYVWLRERLSPTRIAGLAAGFAGVVVLMWDKSSLGAAGSRWAFAAALAAAFLYGLAANYLRRRLAHTDSLTIATGGQVGAAVVLAPLALFELPAATPGLSAWLAVIALGVVSNGAAHILYFRLVAASDATAAVAVAFLIPLFGMLWGALFLSESITLNMALGTAIILSGTAMTTGLWSRIASRAG